MWHELAVLQTVYLLNAGAPSWYRTLFSAERFMSSISQRAEGTSNALPKGHGASSRSALVVRPILKSLMAKSKSLEQVPMTFQPSAHGSTIATPSLPRPSNVDPKTVATHQNQRQPNEEAVVALVSEKASD